MLQLSNAVRKLPHLFSVLANHSNHNSNSTNLEIEPMLLYQELSSLERILTSSPLVRKNHGTIINNTNVRPNLSASLQIRITKRHKENRETIILNRNRSNALSRSKGSSLTSHLDLAEQEWKVLQEILLLKEVVLSKVLLRVTLEVVQCAAAVVQTILAEE
jgi:hypothetical protein